VRLFNCITIHDIMNAESHMFIERRYDMTFGENLKTLRNSRSISQTDLAAQLGYSFQNISKWERNESLPDV